MNGNDDYEAWILYAHNDLSVAIREMERAVNPKLRPYEVILYHCQQSSEKMLKAFLICNGIPVIFGSKSWGHDLNALRTSCSNIDKGFAAARIVNHCSYLGLFASVRYPDFTLSIDASHATRGINSAKRLFDFVSEKLGYHKRFFTK
jgi:HEPN domain-containing protein